MPKTRLRWKNIGPHEREKRKLYGLAALVVGICVALMQSRLPDLAWVLSIGFVTWCAAICLLQWRAGVCVFHAAMGMKNFDRGSAPIRSARMRRIVRRRAVDLHLLAATSWGVATTLGTITRL